LRGGEMSGSRSDSHDCVANEAAIVRQRYAAEFGRCQAASSTVRPWLHHHCRHAMTAP
jgi:hypothetical protein